jgi:hypothetical protein
MEVVKIPQQRENLLNILDDTSSSGPRIEVIVMNIKQQKNTIPTRLRGQGSTFYISLENHDFTLHN